MKKYKKDILAFLERYRGDDIVPSSLVFDIHDIFGVSYKVAYEHIRYFLS